MPSEIELQIVMPLAMPVGTQRASSPPPDEDVIGYVGEDKSGRYFMPLLGRCLRPGIDNRWSAVVSHPETGPERWHNTINRISSMHPVRTVLRAVFDAYAERTDSRIAALEKRIEDLEKKLSFLDDESPL